jgi:aminoglycoside phosphotransferase (APT) family kinase protein
VIATDVKLAPILAISQPERLQTPLGRFLGADARDVSVELTRLQPPRCYWAVYRHGQRRITLKSLFLGEDFARFVAQLEQYYPDRLDVPGHPDGGIVVLPEINSVLWSFPFDPQMPNLGRCLDVAWIASLLPRPTRRDLAAIAISYNPEIGAVFGYRDARRGHAVAYGKVAPEDTCGRIFVVMQELWGADVRRRGRPRLARPLAYRADTGLLLQAAVPGRSVPGRRNHRRFVELVDQAGRGLAAIHASRLPFGPERSLEQTVDRLRLGLADLELTAPALHGALRDLIAQLGSRARKHPAGPAVPSHGDYKWDQFLKHRARFGLIDFEFFCQAESALDLGYFCAYLADPRPDDWREGAAVELLRHRFLRAYARASQLPIDLERVAMHEAATLAIRAMSYVWGFQPGWEAQASEMLDLGFERLADPEPRRPLSSPDD